jgi:hypothetical protein
LVSPNCADKVPRRHDNEEFADMVHEREPLVDDIIGFMDSVSFPSECTDECVEQNTYYCGYDCDTMVNNVFAYGPDGKVFLRQSTFQGVGRMVV